MQTDINQKIIFVYNADSDFFSQIKDLVIKITTPEKYTCNLCAVTYGPLEMKNEWKNFLKTLPQEKVFMHRDEFHSAYLHLSEIQLPVILSEENNIIKVVVSADEINREKTLSGLEHLVRSRLK